MFITSKCQEPGCTKNSLTVFSGNGYITEAPGFCLEHSENKEEAEKSILDYINRNDKIIGLSACGITFDGIELKNKKFYGCNFQHCNFKNVHSDNLRIKMCMFDFSTFTDCDFLESHFQFNSLAGSKLVHVIFTGSDLVHNNFNGITSYQSSFDNSDLYNSSFIKAVLLNTSMKNCNLKKTIFYESVRNNVSFKLSNTKEALVDRNKASKIELISTDETEEDKGSPL